MQTVECKDVSLLSIQEFNKYKSFIAKLNYPWWLRSTSHIDNYALAIENNKEISYYSIDNKYVGVRPVIRVDAGVTCHPGARFLWFDYKWTVLDVKETELFAICDNFVFKAPFDYNKNDWNTSSIKTTLNKFFRDTKTGSLAEKISRLTSPHPKKTSLKSNNANNHKTK